MREFFLKIYIILVLSIIPFKPTYCEVFIIAKIDQEIITNVDLDFEKRYLVSLNPNLKKLDQIRISEYAKDSLINEKIKKIEEKIIPSLNELGIEVFGVMPKSPLLRSVTVGELIRRLKAKVICCPDKDELLVETLSIGAMGVNSAMEFFKRRRNMAVVTGADRTDIQLAALEASTQCLILTGIGDPLPQLIHRAEELEVPILKVDIDTLASVEVIEQAFGHVRLHESIKASYAIQLVQENVNIKGILEKIGFDCNFSKNC